MNTTILATLAMMIALGASDPAEARVARLFVAPNGSDAENTVYQELQVIPESEEK
jgi:hypothetical protein